MDSHRKARLDLSTKNWVHLPLLFTNNKFKEILKEGINWVFQTVWREKHRESLNSKYKIVFAKKKNVFAGGYIQSVSLRWFLHTEENLVCCSDELIQ